MADQITPRQWLALLDGDLAGTERTEIEAHLAICPRCQELWTKLIVCERCLKVEAEKAAQTVPVDAERSLRVAETVLERIRRDGAVSNCAAACSGAHFEPEEGVAILSRLLRSLFGSGMAQKTIEAATFRTVSHGRLSPENWGHFVSNLCSIVGNLVGGPSVLMLERAAIAIQERRSL